MPDDLAAKNHVLDGTEPGVLHALNTLLLRGQIKDLLRGLATHLPHEITDPAILRIRVENGLQRSKPAVLFEHHTREARDLSREGADRSTGLVGCFGATGTLLIVALPLQ